jgi:hypothetical protein
MHRIILENTTEIHHILKKCSVSCVVLCQLRKIERLLVKIVDGKDKHGRNARACMIVSLSSSCLAALVILFIIGINVEYAQNVDVKSTTNVSVLLYSF